MPRALGPVVLVILAAVALTTLQGRAEDHENGPAAPAAATSTPSPVRSTSSTATTLRPTPEPAPTTAPDLDPAAVEPIDPPGVVVDPGTPAVARDTQQAARFDEATQVAEAFMRAFARPAPTTSAQAWWTAVEPTLSDRVAPDYQATDPATVPFTTVTGPGVVTPTDAPADLLTVVLVPTDAGTYTVELERTEAGFAVTRATASEGTQR